MILNLRKHRCAVYNGHTVQPMAFDREIRIDSSALCVTIWERDGWMDRRREGGGYFRVCAVRAVRIMTGYHAVRTKTNQEDPHSRRCGIPNPPDTKQCIMKLSKNLNWRLRGQLRCSRRRIVAKGVGNHPPGKHGEGPPGSNLIHQVSQDTWGYTTLGHPIGSSQREQPTTRAEDGTAEWRFQ